MPQREDRICTVAEEPDKEGCSRCKTLRDLADSAAFEKGVVYRRLLNSQIARSEALTEVIRLRKLVDQCEEAFEAILRSNHERSHAAAKEMLAIIEGGRNDRHPQGSSRQQ